MISALLLREGDNVSLEAGNGVGAGLLGINLVKVGTDAQQCPAWADWREIRFFKAIARVEEIFYAIPFAEDFAVVEGVDEKFIRGCLETAEEMSRHADTRDGQVEAPR